MELQAATAQCYGQTIITKCSVTRLRTVLWVVHTYIWLVYVYTPQHLIWDELKIALYKDHMSYFRGTFHCRFDCVSPACTIKRHISFGTEQPLRMEWTRVKIACNRFICIEIRMYSLYYVEFFSMSICIAFQHSSSRVYSTCITRQYTWNMSVCTLNYRQNVKMCAIEIFFFVAFFFFFDMPHWLWLVQSFLLSGFWLMNGVRGCNFIFFFLLFLPISLFLNVYLLIR